MKIYMLLIILTVCCANVSSRAEDKDAPPAKDLKPGAAFVFFDDEAFRRPGSHGVEEQIKSHGVTTEIESHGIEEQIDLDIEGINGFSKLWVGYIEFPTKGEVTFLAEVDTGMRLYIGEQCIIDAWSRDGARRGKIRAAAGQTLPLRVEYVQSGGASYLRLYWQWEGHPRELVPPSAFSYEEKDLKFVQDVAEGRRSAAPGNVPPVVSVPTGKEELKSNIYQPQKKRAKPSEEPIRLRLGPHLFIDDFLIESSNNVKRRVNRPRRDPSIPNPIITGKEDGNFQPYMTVVRDQTTGRFRIWYNTRKDPPDAGSSHIGYMESDDGIHWIRPHRVLKDPGPINFCCSVIDQGTGFSDPSKRYKVGWWNAGGLKIATSPDGLEWTLLRTYPVIRHNHDINNIFRDTLRNRYVATVSVYTTGPTWQGQRRTTMMSVSDDLLNWKRPWYVITADDSVDKGQTQFYAMNGYLNRGDLLIGLVKVLRDDLVAPDTPKGAYGVGYTTLAWTRDGEHWVRDPTPFFEPDPNPAAWDHAHAWLDYQLPLGDEVYIYYGGYKYGHKMDRWAGRQIGLVRIRRDRYVSRDAGVNGGTILTPLLILGDDKMMVNADVNGELRVRLLNKMGKPIPGFDAEDCKPVKGDSLRHPIEWKAPLATLRAKQARMEIILRDARLYGFELVR